MKPFAAAIALVALLAPSASPGDASAAMAGSVIDVATGHPLAGIVVEVARSDGREPRTVVTDKHGFFVVFGLDPDRYVVTAREAASSCRIEEVGSGQMRRVRIVVGARETACVAGRSPGSLVDPDDTSDVYRIP